MNTSIIRYILGHILKVEAFFMLLPCAVAVIYREPAEGLSFLVVLFLCGTVGILASVKKPASSTFYLKEGCVATALGWILLSIFGSIPFVLTGEIPSFTDALFETVSGFTTTGASILESPESLSHCSLFWRSFTHWIGGMGVLVFLLAVVSLGGASNFNLMKAESPGPAVGKLVPKVQYTARFLYLIYVLLTIIEFIFLICGGMPVFDALTTSFGTAGTGGFGVKNDSLMSYSPYIQWIVTIFMILFGVNFNAYYFILIKQFKKAFKIEEIKYYLIIIAVSIFVITVSTFTTIGNLAATVRHASFQVASIITTTGYATVDFNAWSQTAKCVLVLLMFIGACAGSTGGGIKVSRFVVLAKTVVKELNSFIHPRSIKKINVDNKPIEHEVVRAVNVYFITFMILFCLSVFLISFENKDAVTNFTAVAATINNIGPGLEIVGPTGNFSCFGVFSKYVLIFDMLAGRLELFPLLIMFHPAIWKDVVRKKIRR